MFHVPASIPVLCAQVLSAWLTRQHAGVLLDQGVRDILGGVHA
jgi:hypothetical protein